MTDSNQPSSHNTTSLSRKSWIAYIIWVYSGVLPWSKGVAGIKWRDLDEAVYFQGPVSGALRSYCLRIGHRFTKSSEIT